MSYTKNTLSNAEVCERYGVTRQTIWRRVKEGRFPAPTGRAGKGSAWAKEVLDLFDKQINEKSLASVQIALGHC